MSVVTGYPPPVTAGSGSDLHLMDLVRVAYKHRWIAATSFLLVVLSTTVYTFLATPIYVASARLLIETADLKVVSFDDVLDQQRTADYYQTQYKILESRALAKRTLDALKLWGTPPFGAAAPAAPSLVSSLWSAPRDLVASWFSTSEIDHQPAVNETAAQSAAIDSFLQNLTVTPVRNSRLVDVLFRSTDPVLAAKVANELANGYIQSTLENRFETSKEATDFLSTQLGEQRKKVEASERALQAYREQNDAVSLEDRQNIVVQKLADLNAAVTRARTERIQKEAVFNQVRALQNTPDALESLPGIVSNTFIQQQKGQLADLQRQRAQSSDKLGPRHPDMQKLDLAVQSAQARVNSEIAKVIESLRNDYQQALAQEQSLNAALEQQKGDALNLNRKSIDYNVIARDATSNRQVYESLMQRLKETGVSGELRTSNVRIVDPAETPRGPASPNKRANVLLGIAIGAILAAGCVLLFEYVDDRIKDPGELQQHLGVPFLGLVPALGKEALNGQRPDPLISDGAPANFTEAFRGVRTNLLFSFAEGGSRSIVVTSTAPGEGKTVVAANVAVALAIAGDRVLLIDADMRKPRVHDIFAKPQKPGLSDVLVGTAKASESVHKTGVPGLWVMPAGEHPPNPAELLGSRRYKELLASISGHFEWVIIDTPPAMAVTDAAIVAHSASGVLFVVRSEATARAAAKRAVAQLDQAKAKIVGAVLNRVDLQRNAYYYSAYYRASYADYYQRTPRAAVNS